MCRNEPLDIFILIETKFIMLGKETVIENIVRFCVYFWNIYKSSFLELKESKKNYQRLNVVYQLENLLIRT